MIFRQGFCKSGRAAVRKSLIPKAGETNQMSDTVNALRHDDGEQGFAPLLSAVDGSSDVVVASDARMHVVRTVQRVHDGVKDVEGEETDKLAAEVPVALEFN